MSLCHEPANAVADGPTLADKVTFLSQPGVYGRGGGDVARQETHMSWLFLANGHVLKLKKPVRFSYLDFSTLARRQAACQAELKLNRRLASDVYLDVVPLVETPRGLAIGKPGVPVEWLVVMRRLDEAWTLERRILDHGLAGQDLDRLMATLSAFYRHAPAVFTTRALHLAEWRHNLSLNRRILLEPRLALPAGLVRKIDSAQRRFLEAKLEWFAARVRAHHIVDGHGDLRPEHIWIDHPIRIIDCLEFNSKLRAIDPLDELAYLSVECDRLGAAWASQYLKRRVLRRWNDSPSAALFCFYRCYRATLRARLAIAHLLEENPRTPEKWPRLAHTYLRLAAADALLLERMLKKQGDR